jgi:hypothetical protein
VSDLTPNVVLVGGPTPTGSRETQLDEPVDTILARAADGSGVYAWMRSSRFQTKAGSGMLRVYVYADLDLRLRGLARLMQQVVHEFRNRPYAIATEPIHQTANSKAREGRGSRRSRLRRLGRCAVGRLTGVSRWRR